MRAQRGSWLGLLSILILSAQGIGAEPAPPALEVTPERAQWQQRLEALGHEELPWKPSWNHWWAGTLDVLFAGVETTEKQERDVVFVLRDVLRKRVARIGKMRERKEASEAKNFKRVRTLKLQIAAMGKGSHPNEVMEEIRELLSPEQRAPYDLNRARIYQGMAIEEQRRARESREAQQAPN